jgi:hypothetical protein
MITHRITRALRVLRTRLGLAVAALALILGSAAGLAATATAAHASVVYGGRCSALQVGETRTSGGLTYTCRRIAGVGYWWVAVFYGCGAATAPGVKAETVC